MKEALKVQIEALETTQNHIPQSDELAFEGIRREVEARKQRDIEEQQEADRVRLKVLRDSRPH